ncbi:MAG TPA: hypothetical protein VLZ83_11525 [Edaphocola sp.]|nr:hypothetical protein [Edaphocola sp.]
MKKKVIFAVATGLFALATVFNMNVLQSNNAGDVSLDAITVMAQAGGGEGGAKCAYRNETTTEVFGQTVKVCVSGGTGNITCC